MAKNISRDNVIEVCKKCINRVNDVVINAFRENINQEKESSYSQGIERGIENTFAALYDANVNDEEIIRVVCEFWNIPRQEAEDRLLDEKEQAVARNLERYMKRQGYKKREINDFFQMNQVLIRIKRNKDLWKLKDNPERLFKIIQGHK